MTFLTLAGVFVLAADDTSIRGAVRVHFTGTGISDDIATNYFDKLIQIPLRVPRLGANETKAYIALLFLERALRAGQLTADSFGQAKQRVEERLRETWKDKHVDLAFLESLAPSGNVELIAMVGLSERLAPLLLSSSAVQSNPRLSNDFLTLSTCVRRLLHHKASRSTSRCWPSGTCSNGVKKTLPTLLRKWFLLPILLDSLP
jgi:hypothetical protein